MSDPFDRFFANKGDIRVIGRASDETIAQLEEESRRRHLAKASKALLNFRIGKDPMSKLSRIKDE